MGVEDRWERRVERVELTPETVRAMVAPVRDPTTLRRAELFAGGKCNTNYRLDFRDGEALALRVHVRDRCVDRDAAVFARLDRRVPVPEVLHREAHGPAGHAYSVTTCLPGRLLAEVLPELDVEEGRALGRRLGRALARIHAVEFPAPGRLGPDGALRRRFPSNTRSVVDFIDWALEHGRAGERLGPATGDAVRRFVHARAPGLAVTERRYGLVHGDYKAANLLVARGEAGWRLTGVLDWEFASAGTALTDLGILLRHEREDLPAGFGATVAEGFRGEGGVLPDDWRALARLVDLCSLCGFLNGSAHRARLYADVRRLVERTVSAG